MSEEEGTLKDLAGALQRAAVRVVSRIPDEGPVLGWRGFHIDLDEIEDLVGQLRMKARGL
jgi:signal transduction protein with GAF and PtsI domain